MILHNLYLMSGSLLAIEASLDRHGAVFVDEELSLSIGASVNRIRDFALPTLIRIGGFECFQGAADASVLRHAGLDVGLFEQRLIVVDIS